jgi:hypothetical protein
MHFVPPPKKPLSQKDHDSRGVAILGDIASASETLERVFSTLDFASDGLFCEWAYVVDLDGEEGALEVYKGSREGFCEATVGRFGEVGVVQQVLRARFSFGGGEEEFVRACGGDHDLLDDA